MTVTSKLNVFQIAHKMITDEEEKTKRKCTACGGSGSYYMERDLHRSGGMVPCRHCVRGYIGK